MSDLFYVKAYDNKTNEYRLVPAKYLQTAGGDFVVNNNLDYYRADPNYTRANALGAGDVVNCVALFVRQRDRGTCCAAD